MTGHDASDHLDTEHVADATAAYADQFGAAAGAVDSVQGWDTSETPREVLVVAEGDAALAGRAVAAAFGPEMPVPVRSHECGPLPGSVGPGSLVVAVSHGGTDLETLAAARDALHARADLVVVAGTGALAALAEEHAVVRVGIPVAEHARMLAVCLTAATVHVLVRAGVLDAGTARDQLADAAEWVGAAQGRFGPGADVRRNAALTLAHALDRRIPLVHGATPAAAVAAWRFKAAVNANAKAAAFWDGGAGICHTDICGWGLHGDVTRQLFVVVRLRDPGEDWRSARRFSAYREIVEETVAEIHDVAARATTPLGVCLELVAFADWTSLHLAALAGVDPGPTEATARVHEALREA